MDRGYEILMFILCFTFASCGIVYPQTLTVQTNKSIIFQYNSTETIRSVAWGLKKHDREVFDIMFFYVEPRTNPIKILDAVKTTPYKGRVSFVGDLSARRAWFKLDNVILSDAKYYMAQIEIGVGKYTYPTTELIVTEMPKFTDKLPASTTVAIENTELSINCTATGPPPPNITWVNVTNGKTVAEGIGSAILKVGTIQKSHKGMKYRCKAINNPNEQPVDVVTTIEVYYAPEIKSTFVKKDYCIEDKANITVSVDGNPKPTITCKHGQEDSKFQFTIKNDDQYGNYTCNVKNIVGNVTYVVKLIKTNTSCQPPIPKPTAAPSAVSVHPGIIAGVVLAAILAIVGVVIAIIFWRRRKAYERDSTTSHNQTVHMNDLDDGEEQYATPQHANRVSAPKEEPTEQYAVVDKSKKKKKKQPGELIYADLDHEATPSDRPPSDRRPTGSSDQDTVYADINRAQEETPKYGNLQQMDHM